MLKKQKTSMMIFELRFEAQKYFLRKSRMKIVFPRIFLKVGFNENGFLKNKNKMLFSEILSEKEGWHRIDRILN